MKVKGEIIKRYNHIGTFIIISRVDDTVEPMLLQIMNDAGEWEDTNHGNALRDDHYIKVAEY